MVKVRAFRWLAPLALGGAYASGFLVACEYNDPTPRFGYEFEDDYCSNSIDDDYDGLIDCEDPDCVFTSSQCGENVPLGPDGQVLENTFELCSDGIDNDFNGQFDCGDPKCSGIQELCCTKEFTDERCSDGIDNDGNNFADCGDFQCRNGIFVGVCRGTSGGGAPLRDCEETAAGCGVPEASLEACSDRADNDGNGFGDCQDFSCQVSAFTNPDPMGDPIPNTVCELNVELCADGLDNDGNGFADCQDRTCDDAPNCESTYETCFDGIDNDGDGSTDCNDRGCFLDPNPPRFGNPPSALFAAFGSPLGRALAQDCAAVRGPEEGQTPDECNDGIDNDGNGFVDCGDFGCSRSDDVEIIALCDAILENTFEKCQDGIDNDGNGFVDCGDFSCRAADDTNIVAACQESVEQLLLDDEPNPNPVDGAPLQAYRLTPDMKCSDGLDNDNDGFVDCDDWDCSWNPEVTICPFPRVCE